MSAMDWQQKAAALNAIFELTIRIRKPEDWYASIGAEIGGDGFLRGVIGNGATPEDAIEDAWRKAVIDLPFDRYIVIGLGFGRRRNIRWNGFMWIDVALPDAANATERTP